MLFFDGLFLRDVQVVSAFVLECFLLLPVSAATTAAPGVVFSATFFCVSIYFVTGKGYTTVTFFFSEMRYITFASRWPRLPVWISMTFPSFVTMSQMYWPTFSSVRLPSFCTE